MVEITGYRSLICPSPISSVLISHAWPLACSTRVSGDPLNVSLPLLSMAMLVHELDISPTICVERMIMVSFELISVRRFLNRIRKLGYFVDDKWAGPKYLDAVKMIAAEKGG